MLWNLEHIILYVVKILYLAPTWWWLLTACSLLCLEYNTSICVFLFVTPAVKVLCSWDSKAYLPLCCRLLVSIFIPWISDGVIKCKLFSSLFTENELQMLIQKETDNAGPCNPSLFMQHTGGGSFNWVSKAAFQTLVYIFQKVSCVSLLHQKH